MGVTLVMALGVLCLSVLFSYHLHPTIFNLALSAAVTTRLYDVHERTFSSIYCFPVHFLAAFQMMIVLLLRCKIGVGIWVSGKMSQAKDAHCIAACG